MTSIDHAAIEAALDRHDGRACLQISGGKDSLAALYVLRPYWHRITVAWLDSGDAPRETHAQMQAIRTVLPRFLTVRGDQPGVVHEFGIPVDLLPPSAQQFGDIMHPEAIRMQGRYQCCARVLWNPLQQAMDAAGFTLWIRGQKRADALRPDLDSGHVDDAGRELLFPLEGWTDADVLAYLDAEGVPLPKYYAHGRSNIDCCTCPAYLTEFNRAAYLAEQEPDKLPLLQARVAVAFRAIDEIGAALVAERFGMGSKIEGRSGIGGASR